MEAALGSHLLPHESLYRGGGYYRLREGAENPLILQRNYDALEDGPAEEDFPAAQVLVYVDSREIAAKLEARIAGLKLLRA